MNSIMTKITENNDNNDNNISNDNNDNNVSNDNPENNDNQEKSETDSGVNVPVKPITLNISERFSKNPVNTNSFS